VIDLDDGASRIADGPVLSGRVVGGGGACAGQGKTSLVPPRRKLTSSSVLSRVTVDKLSPICRTFASDSATNLDSNNGIPRFQGLLSRRFRAR
jgi:hypothetical protein